MTTFFLWVPWWNDHQTIELEHSLSHKGVFNVTLRCLFKLFNGFTLGNSPRTLPKIQTDQETQWRWCWSFSCRPQTTAFLEVFELKSGLTPARFRNVYKFIEVGASTMDCDMPGHAGRATPNHGRKRTMRPSAVACTLWLETKANGGPFRTVTQRWRT
jgi:hypothetical protein